MAKGAKLSCWPLPLCCYKNGGNRIYKTECRALLIKLGLVEINTSVREICLQQIHISYSMVLHIIRADILRVA